FNIEERTKIGIVKEDWTQLHFKLLQESAKKKLVQKILIIAIDVGEATFGEIGDYYQKTSISLAHHVPGKRFGDVKDSVNARNAFFSEVMKRMKMMMEGDDYTNIIIAGPGFVREQYMNYCIKKEGGLKSKMITEPITSATKSGLYELLRKDTVQALLHDSRIIEETKLVDEFLTRMGKETGDVVYGFDEVTKANEIGAIDTLMITDEMMRTLNAEKDEKMLQLLKNVEKNRGNIVIMSTLHDAGKRIKGFGGLAALLRFKMQY
ncbi:mRNA surveillance protein pelota, partial [Candidatus Bathyarchaeota archaeon]|nr:mRNA surveillance protein pelota [Candidatus Bathyarchaeota archaeon]